MMEIRTDGPTQIVDDYMVGQLTQMGWRLVAIVSYEEAFSPPPDQGGYNGYPQQLQQSHAPFVIKKAKYVIAQPKDGALRELATKLVKADEATKATEKKLADAVTSEKEAQKKLADSTAQVERLSKQTYEHQATRRLLETTIRKMEVDLGRVRQVLGTERFEQIISPQKPAESPSEPGCDKDGRPQF